MEGGPKSDDTDRDGQLDGMMKSEYADATNCACSSFSFVIETSVYLLLNLFGFFLEFSRKEIFRTQ